MRRVPERLIAILGLAALALSALVVSPSPPEGLLLARARAAGPLAALAMELLFALASGAGFLLIGVLAFLRLSEIRSGEEGGARRRRPRPWVAYLLFLVVLVASPGVLRRCSLAFPADEAPRAAQAPSEAAPAAAPAPPAGESTAAPEPEPRAPLSLPLFALAALGGALALGAALYFGVAGRGSGGGAGEGGDAAAAAARGEGIAALRRRLELGDEVRDAIVAAYAEMCGLYADRALARGRDPGRLTAREFAALLRESLGPAAAGTEAEIAALTAAFEKARYSGEACGEEDRSRAVRALRALEAAGGRA